MTDRIVLNIPHSSDAFPYGKDRWGDGIEKEIRRWTDWHTDRLFSRPEDSRIVPVVFPWSRFFCDVERLENDPLEQKGQGIVYSSYNGIERHLAPEEALSIRRNHYDDHIAKLRSALTPGSFLLDCHSFPSDLSDIDVCIGVNEDWSRPATDLVDRIMRGFGDAGYRTALNRPYSNSVSPKMPFRYPSLMVELNKRTYMEDDVQLDGEKAGRLMDVIDRALSLILDGETGNC